MRAKLLLVLAAGLLLGADDAKKDLDQMQGEWVMASGERDGKAIPEEQAKALRRVIKGSSYSITRDGQTVAKGTFKLDPAKTPKTIDIMREEGADAGKPILGIYAFDGDSLKICYSPAGKDRPAKFTSEEGNTLTVWKREKK